MDELFQVALEQLEGVPVLRAVGEIDVSTAPALREQLFALPESDPRVIVDLSEVTFLDSTGLGVLISAHKRLRDAPSHGEVALVVTRPQITKVLEVTGLTLVFPLFASLSEAHGQ
jgi:anti-sigma B factor antagonist